MKGFAQHCTNLLLLAYFLVLWEMGRDGLRAFAIGHPVLSASFVFVTISMASLFVILDVSEWLRRRNRIVE